MMEKNEILGRQNMKKHNSTAVSVCRVGVGGEREKNREGKRKKEGGE